MTMMKMKSKWRWLTSCLSATLLSFSALPALAADTQLTPFTADYIVYRAGKKHGEATRFLRHSETGYQLGYSSDISWLVFSDKRSELSDFTVTGNTLKPLRYLMKRTGSGPNRHYELNLDPAAKTLLVGKNKTLKTTEWQDDWLDPLSYHQQLAMDLKAGKTEFFYNVLNRHGDSKVYHYKVVTEEPLALPYGNIRALRIARIEENSDRQIYAWVAPELDYMLVRLWQGEKNVEQFDVQLHKLQWQETQPTGSP
ncbi:DUF3108 domain-containing protein [Chromatiaceae bacterium AAb-1]|nr:DUF3108 domain-containing protein [Chromatiaceae bacterium AAb-1]